MCLNREQREGERNNNKKNVWTKPPKPLHGVTSMGGWRVAERLKYIFFFLHITFFLFFSFFIRIIHTFIFSHISLVFRGIGTQVTWLTNFLVWIQWKLVTSQRGWEGGDKMLKFKNLMLFSFITCNRVFSISMINNFFTLEPNSRINSNRNQGFLFISSLKARK